MSATEQNSRWWTKAQVRAEAVLRLIAAVPLGYAVASLWAMALARHLPMEKSEATLTATLIAYVIAAVMMIYAYGARTAWRAIWVMVLLCAAAMGLYWGAGA